MAYLFLSLSILANTIKGVAGKKLSYDTKTVNDVSFFYGFRMGLCALIGAILLLIFEGSAGFAFDTKTLLVSFAVGSAFAINCMLWVFAQRKGAYVICDILLVSSSIIPILLSYFIYNEPLSVFDIIGYLVIIGGCFLIVGYNNQINKKVTKSLVFIYVLYVLSFGICDFGKKIFQIDSATLASNMSANGFTFYSFVASTITFLIFYLVTFKKESLNYQKSIFIKDTPYVAVAALLTYAYSYLLIPASAITSTILYPLKNGVTLIANALVGVFIVKEKPTWKLVIGILIVIISIVLISIF